MARFRDDKINLTRRGGQSSAPAGRVRVLLPVLIFLSLALMLLSRLNHSALSDARWRLAEWMSPVLQAAMVPLEPLRHIGRQIAEQASMPDELQRLQTENQKLNSWQWRARELEHKLADLEALSKVVEQPPLNFVTSRVIADSSGAFVRSVMINAGREQNVKSGFPVVNGDGLVGRVVEIGATSARVLLSTDLNSRIPVVIGETNVRAILAGDNGSEPRLIYIPEGATVAIGDDVATSGAGGLFPRGLRIGKVSGDLNAPRVQLRAKLDQLEYLSVLFFEDSSRTLLDDVPPEAAKRQSSKILPPGVAAARGQQ